MWYCLLSSITFVILKVSGWVYLGVKTCEVFLCFQLFLGVGSIIITSSLFLLYVTGECHRFLHRGWAPWMKLCCVTIQIKAKKQEFQAVLFVLKYFHLCFVKIWVFIPSFHFLTWALWCRSFTYLTVRGPSRICSEFSCSSVLSSNCGATRWTEAKKANMSYFLLLKEECQRKRKLPKIITTVS